MILTCLTVADQKRLWAGAVPNVFDLNMSEYFLKNATLFSLFLFISLGQSPRIKSALLFCKSLRKKQVMETYNQRKMEAHFLYCQPFACLLMPM